ncbi:hypothetical protein ACHAW5_008491 [Stephanodiscus triporus]|uniref:Uncharacterized protein n=1 Tax=Stephanodiscus triporus TaxID=2934178 RepID=A0ABD3MJ60_9STRA
MMGGGDDDDDGGDGGGILAKKHRRAMEEYVMKNLTPGGVGVGSGRVDGGDDRRRGRGTTTTTTKVAVVRASDAEREMYAELLLTTSDDDGGERADDDDVEKTRRGGGGGEGDVGAGGAVMGGTGIAEVALPIDERLRSLRATERAAMERERIRLARFLGGGGGGRGGGGGGGGNYSGAPPSSAPSCRATNESNDADHNRPTSSSLDPATMMVPTNFASGPGKRKRHDASSMRMMIVAEDQSSSSSRAFAGGARIPDGGGGASSSSAAAAAVVFGPPPSCYPSEDVRKSDLSGLGASYSHNFQLHSKEWVMRKRDERQTEIDTIQARQEADEGPMTAVGRSRVGFEMSRKLARGEITAPATDASAAGEGGKGPNGEMLRNEWDRKPGGDHRSSDERVWRTFMTNQRNRR